MRIWDVSAEKLCNKHLLGEHAEIHAIWSILTEGKKGYSNHPETRRWRGKLKGLYQRHQCLVKEMERKGFKHNSPLEDAKTIGTTEQDKFIDTLEEQIKILKDKKCECDV